MISVPSATETPSSQCHISIINQSALSLEDSYPSKFEATPLSHPTANKHIKI